MINYRLSQKIKLLGNCEFNQYSNTYSLHVAQKLSLNKWISLIRGSFKILN